MTAAGDTQHLRNNSTQGGGKGSGGAWGHRSQGRELTLPPETASPAGEEPRVRRQAATVKLGESQAATAKIPPLRERALRRAGWDVGRLGGTVSATLLERQHRNDRDDGAPRRGGQKESRDPRNGEEGPLCTQKSTIPLYVFF